MELPLLPDHKYNPWQRRRSLQALSPEHVNRSLIFELNPALSPAERSALRLHALTDCAGFEFVAFSNLRLDGAARLAHGVLLVPCFAGTSDTDRTQPLVAATQRMSERARFVYDGWVPIDTWTVDRVRSAIRGLDEQLALFSAIANVYVDWEPKYEGTASRAQFLLPLEDLGPIADVADAIAALPADDRAAVSRSLGWIAQAQRTLDSPAQFVLATAAIEGLAMYIEREAGLASTFAHLRTTPRDRAQRRAARDACITALLGQVPELGLTNAVTRAYIECVQGIGTTVERHVRNALAEDSETLGWLAGTADQPPLYAFRSELAHGNLDAMSEFAREHAIAQAPRAMAIARRYLGEVLRRSLSIQLRSISLNQVFHIAMRDAVGVGPTFIGPSEMWVLYQ